MKYIDRKPASFPGRPAFALVLAASLIAAASSRGQGPRAPTAAEESRRAVARALEESYPDRPEWLDMLTDIIQVDQLGPDHGWFRRAVAQTRFDWRSTRERLDRDEDGKIDRKEFPGNDGDFARLDRDRDRVLTEVDFDFSAASPAPSPWSILFSRADRDGNGKVTREEFDLLFRAIDGGGQGFLSLSDLQGAFRMPARAPGNPGTPGGPTKDMLIRSLFRQELGSLQPGPALNESAPDFTLRTNDGAGELTLSKLVGPRPVVLVFGNFTCGPFRGQAGNLEKLSRLYRDRATFLMVYVREAHPTDGWRMESNDRVEVALAQPRTYEERVGVARTCGARLGLGFPMLVDTIDDAVGARYSGMPSRLYLIDRVGKVAYKSGRGPFGFKPAELEQSLVMLLRAEADSAASTAHETPPPTGPKDAADAGQPAPTDEVSPRSR